MAFDKDLHPECDTEGPFGIPMKDAVAKAVDELLKANPLAKETGVVKLAAAASVSDVTERTEVSKITTEAVDKDREVVLVKGIDLTHYRDNPVVLLNHDWHSLPLGKALWIKETGNGLTAKTKYANRPTGHQGEWIPDSVYSLIQQGMMPGKSIGFLPLEARPATKAEIAARPELKDTRRILSKSLLVEFSVVTIPSNSEALVESVGKSFPALAAVLGIDPAAEPVPVDDHAALVKRIAEAFPNIDELTATVAEVKTILVTLKEYGDDLSALKYAVRSIRKGSFDNAEPSKPQRIDTDRLLQEIARQFPKSA